MEYVIISPKIYRHFIFSSSFFFFVSHQTSKAFEIASWALMVFDVSLTLTNKYCTSNIQ